MEALKKFKELKLDYEDVCKMIMFYEIEAFLDEPTDDEYNIIADRCYDIFMKYENVAIAQFVGNVAMAYANNDISLEQLKTISKRELVRKYCD